MNVREAIRTRRSVREYLPDALAGEDIRALIEDAACAPNAVNRQAWSFTVAADRSLLDLISRQAKSFMIRNRPLDLPEHLYEKLADPEFDVFYKAPVLIVISATTAAPWIVEDCALAAENLMLSAHAAGLGACWIGLCQPFLASADGKAMLGLSAAEHPIAPIIIGRPRRAGAATPRQAPQIRWIGDAAIDGV